MEPLPSFHIIYTPDSVSFDKNWSGSYPLSVIGCEDENLTMGTREPAWALTLVV